MKRIALLSLGLFGIVISGLGDSRPADACSSSTEAVAISTRHPDLPLSPFVAGHLGVLEPTYARSHLIVAYAWLSGKGLDPTAQRSVLELAQKRLSPVDAAKVAPGLSSAPTPDPVALWEKERARVLGIAPPSPAGPAATPAAGYTTPSYVTIDNCLADSFRVAKDTLLDREQRLGAASPELVGWVHGQEMVFANCADPAKRSIPPALPAAASTSARADRAYQIASAHFYANAFDDAEKRFRAIAADKTSPWSSISGYMLARVRMRRATIGHDPSDKAELGRALAEVDSQLRDPARVLMHASLRKYRDLVRLRVEPQKILPELSAKLSAGGLGADTGPAIDDYTTALDLEESVLEKGPASDELTSFLGVVQGKRTFDFAMAKHAATPSSEAWLVASLMTATRATDSRIGPLVQEALAVVPSSPAFATVRFHAIRLMAARGAPRATVSDLIRKTRTDLGTNVGLSTRNAYAGLAARIAPDLVTFLREAPVLPAGSSEDGGPIEFDPKLPVALPPELADAISLGLPLSSYKDATLSTVLPQGVRAHFAATTWVRASLLGDRATAASVASVTGLLNPALVPYIARVEQAHTEDERRMGLLVAILKFPTLGPGVDGWVVGPTPAEGVMSSSAGYFWCERPSGASASAPPTMPPFVSVADRDVAKKELAALDKLGAGATWLAFEAARVAEALPKDPRAPEMLHLAVRATRFGCKDAKTTAASKRAFQVLHKQYAGSTWAKATPYYF